MRRFFSKATNNHLPGNPNLIPRKNVHTFAFNAKTPAGRAYANDGTGHHADLMKITCVKPNCETTICRQACGAIKKIKKLGNYSHNHKNAETLGSIDYQGNPKTQKIVKAVGDTDVSEDELKNLTEDDMKPNAKAVAYAISTQDIYDKIHK